MLWLDVHYACGESLDGLWEGALPKEGHPQGGCQ